MNAIDERAIRQQLERAVAPLDPAAPPLDTLRLRARRRRWVRLSGAGLVTAGVAATVIAVSFARTTSDTGLLAVPPPSHESLATFAASQHGKHVVGPIDTDSGYYGAFAVKKGVEVVRWTGAWRPAREVITNYGPGRWVVRLSDADSVIPGAAAFEMRYRGGDVSYFGGILSDVSGRWRAERFDRCAEKNISCNFRSSTQPYGHVVDGAFVSLHNTCTPYCAAGHIYRVTWRWNSTTDRFEVAAAHRAGRWADRP